MNIARSRILLTGAAGGIGRCTAVELARRGARLALVDRDVEALAELLTELSGVGADVVPIEADLCDLEGHAAVVERASSALGGLDVLINNAGLLGFRPFADETPSSLDRLQRVNVVAPMSLAALVLPGFRAQGRGAIVNVGSIFGSIGFAYFAAYSASKFAIRGFSEALRRELAGSGIHVIHVAPRATATRLADVFGRMAQATGMKLDQPAYVAGRVAKALARNAADTYIGFPECLFVRLNAVLPRFVDRALRKSDGLARPFAEQASQGGATPPTPATTPRALATAEQGAER